MKEFWKDVVGFEGFYKVSNLGRIKSLKRNGIAKDTILKSKTDRYGYVSVGLRRKGKRTWTTVHRVVAFAFLPFVEGKRHIDHKNMVKEDNRVENLRWCTNEENIRWRYEKTNKYKIGIRPTHRSTFQVRKTINKRRYHVGTFKTLKEAENAYEEFKI